MSYLIYWCGYHKFILFVYPCVTLQLIRGGVKVNVGVSSLVPGEPAHTTLHDLPSLAI